MNSNTIEKPKAKSGRKFAREPQGEPPGTIGPPSETANIAAASAQPEPKPKSKAALLLDLLVRPEGASLAQMVTATDWLPHTTRAALTGIKKKGHRVTSTKAEGVRTYRLVTAEGEQIASPAATEAKAGV